MDQLIETERRGATTTLWLNRPHKLNAFDPMLIQAFGAAMRAAAHDPETRLVVIRGRGNRFCAGMDIGIFDLLRKFGANDPRVRDFMYNLQRELITSIERAEKPVISAAHGLCLGAGFELSLACDIRLAVAGTAYALPEVRLAVIPEAGGCHRLARHIGVSRAKEIAMTGRRVLAEEAAAIGLVHRIVPDEAALDAAIMEYGDMFAQCGPLAVGLIKRVIDTGFELGPDAGLDHEVQSGNVLYASTDANEAYAAFTEHRKPKFRGA